MDKKPPWTKPPTGVPEATARMAEELFFDEKGELRNVRSNPEFDLKWKARAEAAEHDLRMARAAITELSGGNRRLKDRIKQLERAQPPEAGRPPLEGYLAAAEKATPGPWLPMQRAGETERWDIVEKLEDDPQIAIVGPHGTEDDAVFIAMARANWPFTIEYALNLEDRLVTIGKTIQEVDVWEGDRGDINQAHEYIWDMVKANAPTEVESYKNLIIHLNEELEDLKKSAHCTTCGGSGAHCEVCGGSGNMEDEVAEYKACSERFKLRLDSLMEFLLRLKKSAEKDLKGDSGESLAFNEGYILALKRVLEGDQSWCQDFAEDSDPRYKEEP